MDVKQGATSTWGQETAQAGPITFGTVSIASGSLRLNMFEQNNDRLTRKLGNQEANKAEDS